MTDKAAMMPPEDLEAKKKQLERFKTKVHANCNFYILWSILLEISVIFPLATAKRLIPKHHVVKQKRKAKCANAFEDHRNQVLLQTY